MPGKLLSFKEIITVYHAYFNRYSDIQQKRIA